MNKVAFLSISFSLTHSVIPLLYPLPALLFHLSTRHLSQGRISFIATNTPRSLWLFSSPNQSLMRTVREAGSQSSKAALPIRKMSNSLIVIMRLCHLPIIGMIKDEIFREAGLLT